MVWCDVMWCVLYFNSKAEGRRNEQREGTKERNGGHMPRKYRLL